LEVTISFEKGEPVAIDGQKFGAVDLLSYLNYIGGQHGIGRVDLVENRFVGMKSRGIYETPGVTILHTAHRALESITMDREVMRMRDSLGGKISESIYYGFWFSPEFSLLKNLVEESQAKVTGDVRLKLYKGAATVLGRRSPYSLYRERVVTFEDDAGAYDQSDAEGFIRLQSLRLRLGAMD
jgi:argininosuccinate synthase